MEICTVCPEGGGLVATGQCTRCHGLATQNMRLQGKGGLGNTIGNPLETTVFLSHLIFEGTLDRFPGLKICAAHAGGYLASYSGRSDALCGRAGGAGVDCKALKKKPSDTSDASSWSTR